MDILRILFDNFSIQLLEEGGWRSNMSWGFTFFITTVILSIYIIKSKLTKRRAS